MAVLSTHFVKEYFQELEIWQYKIFFSHSAKLFARNLYSRATYSNILDLYIESTLTTRLDQSLIIFYIFI